MCCIKCVSWDGVDCMEPRGEGVKIGNLALDCMEKGLEVIWQGNKLYLYGKVNESVGHLQREELPKKTSVL